MEKVHEAMYLVSGEVVVQMCSEKSAVTNESIIEMINLLSEGDEIDSAVEFAIDTL